MRLTFLALLIVVGAAACNPNLGADSIACVCDCTRTLGGSGTLTTTTAGTVEARSCRVTNSADNTQQFLDTCDRSCPLKNENFSQPPVTDTFQCQFFPAPLGSPAPPPPGSPFANASLAGACPADASSSFGIGFQGDLAAATAAGSATVSPQVLATNTAVAVTGAASVTASTTLAGRSLRFADLDATSPEQNFFGVPVTQTSIHLVEGATASTDAAGNYRVPSGTARFQVNAELAGVLTAFEAVNTTDLTGVYDESAGVFTLAGSIGDTGAVVDASLSATLTFTARPPKADAGPDRSVECGTPIVLSASVSDPDNDIARATWLIDPAEPTGSRHDENPTTVSLAPGLHTAVIDVFDSRFISASDSVDLNVVDTTPPVLADFAVNAPLCLWPPNHKYVVLRVGRELNGIVTDACDPSPALEISGAESSEPDNARGDGDTTNDVVVFPDHVCLRSERAGTGAGRSYVVHVVARDASGNASDPTFSVIVGHDQGSSRCTPIAASAFVEDGDPACVPPTQVSEPTSDAEDVSAGSAAGGCASAPVGSSSALLVTLAVARRKRRR